ncbi:Mitochondrial intermediate peptidase [Thecaphora frezii]
MSPNAAAAARRILPSSSVAAPPKRAAHRLASTTPTATATATATAPVPASRSRLPLPHALNATPPPPSALPSSLCHLTTSRSLPASAAALTHVPPLFTLNHAHHQRDNHQLRALFDAPSSSSSSSLPPSASLAPTGLFQIPSLTTPEHFVHLAQHTLVRAQLLVDRIDRANAPDTPASELRQVVRNLDRLSDLLCGVIDMAELVRNAHPHPHWAHAANAAYELLCGYMNVLNTHTGLYAVLKKILGQPDIVNSLSDEAVAVANVFLRDFEKSGIHLPPAQRQRFVELSDEILVLGRAFLQDIAGNSDSEFQDPSASGVSGGSQATSHSDLVAVPHDWLSGMNPTLVKALRSSCDHSTDSALYFSPSEHPWAFQTILKHAPNDEARRTAFIAANSASRAQIQRLERLLKARAELAVLTGAESYAEMSLGDKMAKRPDHVQEFLRALTDHHRPRAARDLDKLRRLKLCDQLARQNGDARRLAAERHAALPRFAAWDREMYTDAHFRSAAMRSVTPLSPFFSVGSVFAGLSRLFEALYGIRFRAAAVAPGEVWSEGEGDVMKVEVVDEREGAKGGSGGDGMTEGLVGTIYADLWSREGKPGGAAHYTVRCSRRVDLDDEEGDFELGRYGDAQQKLRPEDLGGVGNPLQVPTAYQRDRAGRYQHPVVVLMCDFARPSTSNSSPCLLGWHEVETLFHEMGHAIHSMIGRTRYHNVSGTRCATDFVELPSILMEHFLASPAVVEVTARHYATDAKLPYHHLQAHLEASKSLEALDTYHQIQLARLDQVYHSAQASRDGFDSTKAYLELDKDMALDPQDLGLTATEGAHPQTRFSHLFGYGATYYSYLLDRAIAARVFKTLFKENPLDREAGERVKKTLRYGGGKDAWHLVAELLEDERLEKGGSEAMRIAGKWGIDDDKAQARL